MLELLLHSDDSQKAVFKMESLAPRPVSASHPSCCYYDGKIYVVGGLNNSLAAINSFHAYDIASNTWKTLAPRPRNARSAVIGAANGRIICYGGHSQSGSSLGSVDYYTIANNSWGTTAASIVRSDAAYATIGDEMFIFGGINASNNLITNCNKLNMLSPLTWSTLSAASNIRYSGTAVDTDDNDIYIAGGQNADGFLSFFRRYDVDNNDYQLLPEFPFKSHSVYGTFDSGNPVFYSGYNNGYSSRIFVFDKVKAEWEEAGLIKTGVIHGLSCGVQAEDALYLIGGFNGSTRHNQVSKITRVS